MPKVAATGNAQFEAPQTDRCCVGALLRGSPQGGSKTCHNHSHGGGAAHHVSIMPLAVSAAQVGTQTLGVPQLQKG